MDAKSPGLDGIGEGLVRLSEVQWQVLEKAVDVRRELRRCDEAERGKG